MNTLNYIHLDKSKVNVVVDHLQILLADYQVFYTNLRGFHWNIKGKGFFELHAKFEELYNDVALKIDEVAERILMLGAEPENRFSAYLTKSTIKEVNSVSCGEIAMKNILESYSALLNSERAILAAASEAADESTVSLMSDYIKEQEKLVWMLVAYSTEVC